MTPTLKLLYDRCEEVGDCMIWQQAVNGAGFPIISLSAKKRSMSVRRIAYELANGPIPRGKYVRLTCGNDLCIKCLVQCTKAQYMGAAAKRGSYALPHVVAARTKTIRSKSSFSMEAARSLRTDRGAGMLLRELSAKYGVTVCVASRICLGTLWNEGAQNSSVFNQRAAA